MSFKGGGASHQSSDSPSNNSPRGENRAPMGGEGTELSTLLEEPVIGSAGLGNPTRRSKRQSAPSYTQSSITSLASYDANAPIEATDPAHGGQLSQDASNSNTGSVGSSSARRRRSFSASEALNQPQGEPGMPPDLDRSLLCQLCDEPRATKDRGQGLHIYCRAHKEIRQQAWRKAAKKYRERKRGVYEEDGFDEDNSDTASRKRVKRSKSSGGAKRTSTSTNLSPAPLRTTPTLARTPHYGIDQTDPIAPMSYPPVAAAAAATLIPWPQFWHQKEIMRFVNPMIRQSIKKDFDAFTQGRPGLKTYTYQENYSIEMNAASELYRKGASGNALGKTLYMLEKLTWVEPFVEFLADQWWATGIAMMLEQISRDEGTDEKEHVEKVLKEADTIEKKQRVLYSLLGSMTMLSYSTEDLPEELLGPKHAHMIMVINIHGDGELIFRRHGAEERQPGGRHCFPVSSGDVFCYTGDFRYEMTNRTTLKSDYRCIIILRFWLPGRECLVRTRGPFGQFTGYRRLERRDRDEDNWIAMPGKKMQHENSDLEQVRSAIYGREAEEAMDVQTSRGDGEGHENGYEPTGKGGQVTGNPQLPHDSHMASAEDELKPVAELHSQHSPHSDNAVLSLGDHGTLPNHDLSSLPPPPSSFLPGMATADSLLQGLQQHSPDTSLLRNHHAHSNGPASQFSGASSEPGGADSPSLAGTASEPTMSKVASLGKDPSEAEPEDGHAMGGISV